MFDRFTDRARKALAASNLEASSQNHNCIENHHILVGLAKDSNGIAGHVLKACGFDLEKIQTTVREKFPAAPSMVTMGRIPQSSKAKKTIEAAIKVAQTFDHNYIGTEHLLLGIMESEKNDPDSLANLLGFSRPVIEARVIELLGGGAKSTNLATLEVFMKAAHKGQSRSDGQPYEVHPIDMFNRAKEIGITDEVVLGAIYCHDIPEDTETTFEQLEQVAGKEVTDVVRELTNKHPEGTKFEVKHAALLEHAKHYSDNAKRVKVIDRYSNIVDALFTWDSWRVKRYAKAGIELLNAMEPFPDDIKDFVKESRRLYNCIV